MTGDQGLREQAVTDEVVASFAGAKDERYRVVMGSLVRHLHAFARDVRLTQEEWDAAIGFLTRIGHITDDRRQEFVLLSDVLGLSMLTVGMNAPPQQGATESTVFGPFFAEGAPEIEPGGDIGRGAPGTPCWVSGSVRSTDGTPITDARIDVWEADEDGLYDVQYAGNRMQGRGWLRSGADGGYRFWSVRPAPYPIPDDGPVGELLARGARGPMRPAHVHFMVTAPGFRRLVTHIFVEGDEYLDRDAVFGVRRSLVHAFTEREGGTAPDGRAMDGVWNEVAFDIVLAPEGETT
ncbi:MAG: intradiol ring-cleavage dioxygenase [Pseudonocardia sp.]|nr:intradiol ring-cleavage dioxygenase [Pseudonocardia sp.]